MHHDEKKKKTQNKNEDMTKTSDVRKTNFGVIEV